MRAICGTAQFIFAKAGKWCCWFLGGFDGSLRTLAVLTAAEVLTGIMCAHKGHNLSGRYLSDLIRKLLLIFVVVSVANVLDTWIGGKALRSISLLYYIYLEGSSLVQNMDRLHFPIPEPLRQAIKRLQDGGEGKEGEVRPGKDGDGGEPGGHEEDGHESDRGKTNRTS